MEFLIADTHFGHENIVVYCGRPFKDSVEMDEVIINRWNKIVSPMDIVYHLGDFSLSKEHTPDWYVKRLNGRIVLVMGNHDRRKTATWWKRFGITEAHKKPIEHNGFILSHEPEFFPELPNVHGHTHGNIHRGEVSIHGVHVCVSCEAIGYTPASFDAIESMLKEAS